MDAAAEEGSLGLQVWQERRYWKVQPRHLSQTSIHVGTPWPTVPSVTPPLSCVRIVANAKGSLWSKHGGQDVDAEEVPVSLPEWNLL
ncbi:hypothetical protein Q5P01_024907 [Channa striata]|uniref:Uncharacterized protein n=1 Tax=Channa striata TaxID=64152 RepID=A0AA88ISE5_CHASR|nr:hypothetical protein Q5P01_024907 [Channa striata]